MAMWVGGPPKPVQPMRPHSLAIVDSATSGRASGVGSSGPGSSGMPHVGTMTTAGPDAVPYNRTAAISSSAPMCASVSARSGVHRVERQVARPRRRQRRACSAILSWSRVEYSSLPSNSRSDRSRPTSAPPSRMISSAASRPPPGRTWGNQPSAIRPTRRSAAGAWPPIQIGIGPLHRQRSQPRRPDVVEASVDGDAPLGPQGAQHGDLLLQNGRPLLERHAERVVLELVPADAEPEPEAPAAEQVDLGRLLRQQCRLALRPDQDGRGEGQVRCSRPGRRTSSAARGRCRRSCKAHRARRARPCRHRARGRMPPGGV